MSDYNPYSLEHPNASLTYIVAQLQKYLNDHPLTPDNDPDNPDQYNPISLQLPYASLPWIVAWMQKQLSEGTTDGTPYNPYSLQYPLASLPKIVADIQKYLDTHPIITADEAGQFILDYIADNPGLFPVTSVNGATGAVTLGAADVGAVPTTRTVNGKSLSADIALDAADVGAVPTTREVNGHALSADVTLVPSDLGAVPETRTVNSVPLNDDIVLTAGDIGAVPEDREINGIPLATDLTLTPADLGAVPETRTINGIPLTSDITIPTGGVPPTRTINGYPLSSDITLGGSDIVSGVMSAGNTVNQDLTALNTKIGTCQAIFLSGISIAAVGSTTYTVNGLDGNWQLVEWGFSDGDENDPPAELYVTTGSNSITVRVDAVLKANKTINPMFIKRVTTSYT